MRLIDVSEASSDQVDESLNQAYRSILDLDVPRDRSDYVKRLPNKSTYQVVVEGDEIVGGLYTIDKCITPLIIPMNGYNHREAVKEVLETTTRNTHAFISASDVKHISGVYYSYRSDGAPFFPSSDALLIAKEKPVGIEFVFQTTEPSARQLNPKGMEVEINGVLDEVGITAEPDVVVRPMHDPKVVLTVPYRDQSIEQTKYFVTPHANDNEGDVYRILPSTHLVEEIIGIGSEHFSIEHQTVSEMYHGSLVHKTRERGPLRRPW